MNVNQGGKKGLCNELVSLGPGEAQFIDVDPWEQWFDAIVLYPGTVAPTSGSIEFGAMFQDGGVYYFPISGEGYANVAFGSIPGKGSANPVRAVVSFFGQPTTRVLGIVNGTNVQIDVKINSRPRVIGD